MNNENTKRQENTKTTYKHFFRKPYYNYRKPFVKRYQSQLQNNTSIKRSKSSDNINNQANKQNNQNNNNTSTVDVEALINSIKTFVDNKFKDTSESISTKLRNSINAQVENRCKYYIDQRIGLMLNSDDLLTRGSNSFTISPDAVHGAKAFYFNYMHEPVAYFTYDGRLFCKGLFLNGVNILQTISKIMDDETSAAEALSNYVKHIDLHNGTYELDIKSWSINPWTCSVDTDKQLTYDNSEESDTKITVDTAGAITSTDGVNTIILKDANDVTGFKYYKPDMANGDTIYGLRFGKDNDTGANIRYTYSTTAANQYLAMGPVGVSATLCIYRDKRVIIDTGNNLTQSLLCKYNGNLANSKYLRIGCGDNRDTGIFAYGRESNTNFLYLKLQGRHATIKVYAEYLLFEGSNYTQCTSSKASGEIFYINAANVAAGNSVSMLLGKNNTTTNQSITIGYQHDTSNPLGWFGFYGNDKLITYDKYGNMSMNNLTANNATLASTTVNDLYSAGNIQSDGTIDCHKLNITDTNINTDYLHITAYGQTLGNNDYIRCRLSDSTGNGIIDLFHDTMYYGLRLQVPTGNTDDNKLCIYPTGVTINGDLDCYDDVSIWETLEVAKDISVSDTTYGIKTNNISDYSGGTVTVNSNLYIDNNKQLQTDILNSAFDSMIQCKCSMEVSNEDNDAVLSADNVTVYNDLQVGGVAVNTIATLADVNDNTKINDNTLPTTAYVDAKCVTDYSVTPVTVDTLVWNNTASTVLQSLPINAIAYGDGMYVCVGNTHNMPYSTDGINWTSNIITGNSGNHKGIAYGNGMFVTPVYGTNYCFTSRDGYNWSKRTLPTTHNWNVIGYGNGKFVILGNNQNAVYSTDGITWYGFSMGVTSGTYNWTSIACNGERWVATCYGSSQIYYSNNGTSWYAAATNADSSNWLCCTYGNGMWIAVSIDVGYNDYITSTDGINWTKRTFTGANYNSIAFGGGWFVAVTEEGFTAMSKDGLSWNYTNWNEHSYKGITYCKDKFVTINAELNNGNVYYTTTNLYPQPTYSNSLDTLSQMIIGRIYPVGSIYVSMTPVNPSVIFGFGTWKQIKDRFLYCNDGNADGIVGGGEARHTLTVNEMPSHSHALNKNVPYGIPYNDSYGSGTGGSAPYYHESYNPFSIGNTGGSAEHNNMPPYIQVYAWYRTA